MVTSIYFHILYCVFVGAIHAPATLQSSHVRHTRSCNWWLVAGFIRFIYYGSNRFQFAMVICGDDTKICSTLFEYWIAFGSSFWRDSYASCDDKTHLRLAWKYATCNVCEPTHAKTAKLHQNLNEFLLFVVLACAEREPQKLNTNSNYHNSPNSAD